MNIEFRAPYWAAVGVTPNTVRSMTRSANRVIEAALCSNSAQKTTEEMVRTISTIMRSRSTRSQR
jgi:hypothetical protein